MDSSSIAQIYLVVIFLVSFSKSAPLLEPITHFTGDSASSVPLSCKVNGLAGICMFSFECMQNRGHAIGVCIQGIYVGSCCVLRQANSLRHPWLLHRKPLNYTNYLKHHKLVSTERSATLRLEDDILSDDTMMEITALSTDNPFTVSYYNVNANSENILNTNQEIIEVRPLTSHNEDIKSTISFFTNTTEPTISDINDSIDAIIQQTDINSSLSGVITQNVINSTNSNLVDTKDMFETIDNNVDEIETSNELVINKLNKSDLNLSTTKSFYPGEKNENDATIMIEEIISTSSIKPFSLDSLSFNEKVFETTINPIENTKNPIVMAETETTSPSSTQTSFITSQSTESSTLSSSGYTKVTYSLPTDSSTPSTLFLETKKPLLGFNIQKEDCGIRPLRAKARVVGGRNAQFGEWPWQVLVKEATWLGLFVKTKCGGVLIDTKWVLTAAHCQPAFLASLVVIVGEYDLTGDIENLKPVARPVRRMIIHRNYNAHTFENDIALLELESPLGIQPHVLPICLPQDDDQFVGTFGTVVGWGKLSYGGAVPNVLQVVHLPVLANSVCQRMFMEAGHVKKIRDTFLCAGYKTGGMDSCEGDSGGPLMAQRENGQWILLGTVSHGIKCAEPNLPGVYMRTTAYRKWIHNVIRNSGKYKPTSFKRIPNRKSKLFPWSKLRIP